MTDTVKTIGAGVLGRTVDRASLVAVTSPIVLAPSVVAALEDRPGSCDFAGLVVWLRARFNVRFVEAPALGRRVEDESAVLLLSVERDLVR